MSFYCHCIHGKLPDPRVYVYIQPKGLKWLHLHIGMDFRAMVDAYAVDVNNIEAGIQFGAIHAVAVYLHLLDQFLAALVISGLPTDRFTFEGFLPAKNKRKKRLESIACENRTIVLYESPHRINRTVKDLLSYCGDREVVLVREVTKLYEEVIRTNLSGAVDIFERKKPQGEYVLILRGAQK